MRHRRLLCEPLEDRRLLSVGAYPELPGLQLIDPRPGQFDGQIIYLDFDGAEDVTYNGPVTIGPFDVPAFQAPGELAGQEEAIIASVLDQLQQTFAGSGVLFTAEVPHHVEHSTVYVGGYGSVPTELRGFAGLAEQVDVGNSRTDDRAFVFSPSIGQWGSPTVDAFASQLATLIAHESGHLLGYAHDSWKPSRNSLYEVAAVPPERTFTHPAEDGSGDNIHDITLGPGTYTFRVDPDPNGHHFVDWYDTYSRGAPVESEHLYYYDDHTFTFRSQGPYWVRAELYRSNWLGQKLNWEAVYRWRVTIDTKPPTRPGQPDMLSSSDSGKSDSDHITNESSPTFSWSASDDTGTGVVGYEYRLNSGSWRSTGNGNNPSFTLPSQSDGTYILYIRAVDGAGNRSEPSPGRSFIIDTQKPGRPTNLTNPADRTLDRTPNVSWSAPESGIWKYEIAWSAVR